jgi:hypothetical protein
MSRIAQVSAISMLVGSSIVITAAPASAIPSNCSVHYVNQYWDFSYQGGRSICYGGWGEHRVRIRCDINNWPDYHVEGSWKTVGSFSEANCRFGDRAYGISIELR